MLTIYKKVEKNLDNLSGIIQIKNINELNKPFLLCLSAQNNHDKSIYGIIREGTIAARVYTSKDPGARFKIDDFPVYFLGLRYQKDNKYKENYEEIVDDFLYPFLIGKGKTIDEIKKQARRINLMTYCDGTEVYCKVENRIIQRLTSDGFSGKDIDDIISQISLTAIGTMVDTSILKANTVTFIDVNDTEISNNETSMYKKELQKRNKKSIYGTFSGTNNTLYVYDGSGEHDLKEYFKDDSIVKPAISGVLTSFLENSIENEQSQSLIRLSSSDSISRLIEYADESISSSSLLEKLDNSLSYNNEPKYTEEEIKIRQELDIAYQKLRQTKEELERVQKQNNTIEEKMQNVINGIKENCTEMTFYKILVPSGMWQLPPNIDISQVPSDREIIEGSKPKLK